MSYNIDSVTILSSSELRILRIEVARLREDLKGNLPECHFLDEIVDVWTCSCAKQTQTMSANFCSNCGAMLSDKEVTLDGLQWCGSGSGHTFEEFKTALRSVRGRADLLLVWEGGDSMTGLRVEDGRVTEHDVLVSLGEERS